MAFHAWTAPHTTYRDAGARSLHFARVTFEGDDPAERTVATGGR